MPRRKPKIPPDWAPLLPDARIVKPQEWQNAWDKAAQEAYMVARDDNAKTTVVVEYVLGNRYAALHKRMAP